MHYSKVKLDFLVQDGAATGPVTHLKLPFQSVTQKTNLYRKNSTSLKKGRATAKVRLAILLKNTEMSVKGKSEVQWRIDNKQDRICT